MKSGSLNINEVRTICQELVKTNGDCFEVAKKTSFPLELIRKIKSKEYMKSISDSYFDSNKWNPKAGVHEPERISLATESTPTTKPEPVTTSPTEDKQLTLVPDAVEEANSSKPGCKKKEISKTIIDRACEMLANGEMINSVCKATHLATNYVSDIKMKRKHKDVSDKYFDVRDGKLIRLSDNTVVAVLHNNTAYTEDVVRAICKGIAEGLSNIDLSEKYGMSAQNISKIRTKKIYKKISDKYFTKVADGRKNSTKRTPTAPVTTPTVDANTTITKNTTDTTNTSTNIIDSMIMNVMKERSISELPESLREKIMAIISEYIDTLTVKELKELMK